MFAIRMNFKNQNIQLWCFFLFFIPQEATNSLDKFKYLFSTTNVYWEQQKV